MSEEESRSVAVIGASRDRGKFGNRAVRAYRAEGWQVHPVNPGEMEIEGLPAFPTVGDIPGPVHRVLLYVQPELVLPLLDGIARKGAPEIFFNPGTESPEAVAGARELGLEVRLECGIVAIGRSPADVD